MRSLDHQYFEGEKYEPGSGKESNQIQETKAGLDQGLRYRGFEDFFPFRHRNPNEND